MKQDFSRRVENAFSSFQAMIDSQRPIKPKVGIILGSGLGEFVDRIEGRIVPYSKIRDYPVPTVEGHRGLCKLGRDVVVMAGRFHYYEGWEMDDVVLPVFLLARMGIRRLVVTNAAGAVNTSYKPGELVLISDHLNLIGRSPLIGPNAEELGPRFPDMSQAYSPELRAMAKGCLGEEDLKEGVYAALSGPAYETPAEIRMLSRLGADMVGMSTVPEVLAARYAGIEVLGISCITNMAAGILARPLSHSEVMETGREASSRFTKLLLCLLQSMDCSVA